MPQDPLPFAFWILELGGQFMGAMDRADFPTATLMTLEFSMAADLAMFTWISQSLQGQRRAMPGNLVVLDTSLSEVHRNAWDWGSIRQIVFPAMEAQSGSVPHFRLALQIANLHEVPTTPIIGRGSGHRRGNLSFFSFKVEVDGLPVNHFVRKVDSVTVNLGPTVVGMRQTDPGTISKLVMTMTESNAAGFRTWMRSGGQRDVTIHYLSTGLETLFQQTFKDVTISHIDPAAPLNVGGDTKVTMNVGGVAFSL
jgi:hypothetical protein